jgi:hypothetical protein
MSASGDDWDFQAPSFHDFDGGDDNEDMDVDNSDGFFGKFFAPALATSPHHSLTHSLSLLIQVALARVLFSRRGLRQLRKNQAAETQRWGRQRRMPTLGATWTMLAPTIHSQ